jgi:hypothetical protein
MEDRPAGGKLQSRRLLKTAPRVAPEGEICSIKDADETGEV